MDAVEEVKARVDIEQIVGQHVDLKRSGAGLKGLCPFHAEKTPSFFVFPARGTFHCFGCGKGGDILTFVQNYEKVDFREALQRLASRAGIELPDERDRLQKTEENARLYQVTEAALDFFRDQLKSPAGKRSLAYLDKRKIAGESQHAFSIGFAPDSRVALRESLSKRGFSDQEMIAAGLLFAADDGAQPRDRFHGRLMFPIRDAKGRVTGFGGRIMGDGEPKYLNSPQTEIFDKSRSLFGVEHAQETIRAGRRAVVVEGYIDAIRAHATGFRDVVASLGTAITTQQLQLCARMAPTVVLALDPDPAGQAAAARTGLAALAALPRKQRQLPDSLGRRMVDVGLSVDLRIARIPADGGDPDELIQRDPDEWERVIAHSVPAFEFYFDSVVSSVNRSAENWRQDLIDRILPVIQEFSFAIGTQAAWLERLGEVTGVQSRLLQNKLAVDRPTTTSRTARRSSAHSRPQIPPPTIRPSDPETDAEDSLLRVLLRFPAPEAVAPALADIRSQRMAVGELLDRIILHAGTGRRPNLTGLSHEAGALAEQLLSVETEEMRDSRVIPAVRLHVAVLRLSNVRRRSSDLQIALSDIGAEDRETGRRALQHLLEERQSLEYQIAQLQRDVVVVA